MTNSSTQTVFVDQEVVAQILGVIDQARQNVVLVSPYLNLWQHAQNAIDRAIKRGVSVQMFLRNEQDDKRIEDIQWLLNNKVRVFVVERLHAKIYMNEQTIFLSSMNLTESSALNSMEIAYSVRDPDQARRIRDYVRGNIASAAVQVPMKEVMPSPAPARGTWGQSKVRVGFCIRCGKPRAFDTEKPLCDDCYDSWAEYENEEYPEKACHSCGQRAQVTYARPLCERCYRGR